MKELWAVASLQGGSTELVELPSTGSAAPPSRSRVCAPHPCALTWRSGGREADSPRGSSCVPGLQPLDVLWAQPQALRSEVGRPRGLVPMRLVQKELPLINKKLGEGLRAIYLLRFLMIHWMLQHSYHIKQEVRVLKHDKVVRKKYIDFHFRGKKKKKKKICTGMHFPSLPSFANFTWLVITILAGCVHIK